MHYQLKIGEDLKEIEVFPSERASTAQVVIKDQKWELSFQAVAANHLRLTIDGSTVNAYLAQGAKGKQIVINGQSFQVEDLTGQNESEGRRKKSVEVPSEVTPPMPAVVVRILVQEGDWVSKGQGLIVVSAMKMETTLKAPKDGQVQRINTALQAKVMPGDKLVDIKEGLKDDGS